MTQFIATHANIYVQPDITAKHAIETPVHHVHFTLYHEMDMHAQVAANCSTSRGR